MVAWYVLSNVSYICCQRRPYRDLLAVERRSPGRERRAHLADSAGTLQLLSACRTAEHASESDRAHMWLVQTIPALRGPRDNARAPAPRDRVQPPRSTTTSDNTHETRDERGLSHALLAEEDDLELLERTRRGELGAGRWCGHGDVDVEGWRRVGEECSA